MEQQEQKKEKFVPEAPENKHMRFNSHIIHYMYLKKQKQVTSIKNILIFEDTKTKKNNILHD